jgi:hypothetical protein
MGELPSYDLKLRAEEDRRRLHQTFTALRCRVREEMNWEKQTRDRIGTICAVAALAGLGLGYSVTGLFVSR